MMHPCSSKPRKEQPSGKTLVYYLKISRVHLMPEDLRTLIYRSMDNTKVHLFSESGQKRALSSES